MPQQFIVKDSPVGLSAQQIDKDVFAGGYNSNGQSPVSVAVRQIDKDVIASGQNLEEATATINDVSISKKILLLFKEKVFL